MSILTEQTDTPAQAAARRLVEGVRRTKGVLIAEFRQNVLELWDNEDPQAVLDAIGSDAEELFYLSNQFATFLHAMLTHAGDAQSLIELGEILGKVKPVTVHEDGAVTINPEPTPTPEP